MEHGTAPASLLEGYEDACRPAARANVDASFENLVRPGEIARVLGPCADRAALERRLASLGDGERQQLAKAIEVQRSHSCRTEHSPARPDGGDAIAARPGPGASTSPCPPTDAA